MLAVNALRQLSLSPCSAKRAKPDDIHGFDSDWEKNRAGRTKAKTAQSNNNPPAAGDGESMVEFGGLAADDESDVEAKELNTKPPHLVLNLKKPKKLYVKSNILSPCPSDTDKLQANVKIEPNTTAEPSKSTLKSFRNGAENWLLEHLPAGTSRTYTNDLIPRARKAIGSTTEDPWDPLPTSELQVIVNEVFGSGKYNVEMDPSWFGLVCYSQMICCIANYCYILDEIPPSRLAKRICERGNGRGVRSRRWLQGATREAGTRIEASRS